MLEFDMRRILHPVVLLLLIFLTACYSNTVKNLNEKSSDSAASAISILEQKEYQIDERFLISNLGPGLPSKHNLWIALITDHPPYQEVLERSIIPQNYHIFSDEYGNQIAEFDLVDLPAGNSISVVISYRLKVNRVAYDLSDCEGELPSGYTNPDLHIESNNPQIKELSEQLTQGLSDVCSKVRAFYDYVGNNLVYSYNRNDWGAQAALGEMGSDCTEYASLMIALCRASGIPARYLEGLVYLNEPTKDLARREHAWLEVYLPQIGWTAMDPTMGRSSLSRDKYFASHSPDHIIVTRGRNPSALRGSSYYSHIYWPGDSTTIKIEEFTWLITLLN
ncbi:MAG: transglutaminase-like domain-containing protein [Anaerolineales bacterium]|jgi:transglutaminase-like putative cysteine protease